MHGHGRITRPYENFDALIDLFRRTRGLYVVGAGASRPHAPLGGELDIGVIRHYADIGSYSVMLAHSHPRLVRILSAYEKLIPFSNEPESLPALIRHMSTEQAFLSQLMQIAKVRAKGRSFEGVRVFREFRSGIVITYNVDGLLLDLPGNPHRIVDAHGSVPLFLASPSAASWIEPGVAEAIAPEFAYINIDERERWNDLRLATKLAALNLSSPDFVAIIGYTFARQQGGNFNDWVSLYRFCKRFALTRGTIFVIDPAPEQLAVSLHNALPAATIVCVPARWDLIAKAFFDVRASGRSDGTITGRYRSLQARGL